MSWRRSFFTLWAGQAFSILTSSVVQWAIIFYLTFTTDSGAVLSFASLSAWLPGALLGPIAGSVVDRLPRKAVLIAADSFVALTTAVLVLAWYTNMLSMPLIFAVLLLRAIGQTFHTPAIQSTTPLLVPEDHLMEVGGYTQAIQSLGYIAGTVGGAILYSLMPFGLVLSLDIIGAGIAVAACFAVHIPHVVQEHLSRIPSLQDLFNENREALRLFRAKKGFSEILVISFLFMLVFAPLIALYPLMTIQHFGAGQIEASIVEMCFAGGMMVGGVLIGKFFDKANRGYMISLSALVTGIFTWAMGVLPTSWLFVFYIFNIAVGLATAAWNTPFNALMQERIAPTHLGRCFALFGSVTNFATLFGFVFSGLTADSIGVALFFQIVGASIVVIGIACFCLKNIRDIENVEEPATA